MENHFFQVFYIPTALIRHFYYHMFHFCLGWCIGSITGLYSDMSDSEDSSSLLSRGRRGSPVTSIPLSYMRLAISTWRNKIKRLLPQVTFSKLIHLHLFTEFSHKEFSCFRINCVLSEHRHQPEHPTVQLTSKL